MTPTATASTRLSGSVWRREFWPAWVAMLAGVLLAVLPHLLRLGRTGDPTWLSDVDELVPYGQQVSFAYHQHPWRMGDPALERGGATVFPWIQFGPYLIGARALGTGPMGTFILMRIWAGASLALGFYLVLRGIRPGWLAAGLSILLISDQGLLRGTPLTMHAASVLSILQGQPREVLQEWSQVLPQLRMISPGMSLFSLLLTLFLLLRLHQQPSRRHAIHAGLGLGLCIATYLYFWTAAVIAIGCLAILQPSRWKLYFIVLAIGGCVGSPALLQNFITKLQYGDEWLVRNEYFVPVVVRVWDPPRFAIAAYTLLAVYVFRFRPGLQPLWWTGVAAILLSQSHHVTGVLLQPFHWLMVPGPLAAILFLHAAADAWRRWVPDRFPTATVVSLLVLAQFSGGLVLRGWATDHNRASARIEERRQSWLAFLRDNPALHLAPNSVIAGDPEITDWAVFDQGLRPITGSLGISPSVNNAQWMRRRVLNGYLKGFGKTNVHGSAFSEHSVWFELGRMDESARNRQIESMRETWRDIDSHPNLACNDFSVRYLMTPANSVLHPPVKDHWQLIASNASWELRERPLPPR